MLRREDLRPAPSRLRYVLIHSSVTGCNRRACLRSFLRCCSTQVSPFFPAKIMLSPSEPRGSVAQRRRLVPRSSTSDSQATTKQEKAPFGYTRKDVLLIGLGVTAFGVGLKSGLEFLGVDPLQAGNVVQLLVVLGMTVGWISTYMFRVANKDMTYAHQLRDYEKQVMEKRLESLSEAELQALLEQVEEEKQRMPAIPDEPNAITFNKN
ncbi:hypothetical protein PR202_gb04480 [Eleusine coracana subsp. coracana]|uniref:Transmembrane protein n=1 Tax=Eleusine coracana subsp. coracana TaxID=191504 RepID=A0AAV5E3W4_ELECO|nr:hypothetical protein PR202_gb04480 [Eleusine coracana subsp. coracana]